MTNEAEFERQGVSRRRFLRGSLGVAGAVGLGYGLRRILRPTVPVFVGQAQSYDDDLVQVVSDGLRELGVTRTQVKGKKILLKPNLVETKPDNPHINTNPLLLLAVAEAFRQLDAAEVAVAEGQGHRRDSWLVLEESGYLEHLQQAKLPYTDLNHDDLRAVPNRGGFTRLNRLFLPRRLEWADLFVSVAKLKTHHWVGCTLSLKNLFGIMPGIYYGWPKNVLHHEGIPNCIVDINATHRMDLAIVDGVVGMEGDGPINGVPKQAGVIVMGRAPASVDATCARIMNLRVDRITYLRNASSKGLGPLSEDLIEQRGATLGQVAQDFALEEWVKHLAPLKEGVAKRG